nr:hypothetical protein Iba_chr07bCG1560 [Ipomoea batatas]
MGNTAIDGILKPSLSFIRDGDSSFTAITNRKMSKKFGHIASPKNLNLESTSRPYCSPQLEIAVHLTSEDAGKTATCGAGGGAVREYRGGGGDNEEAMAVGFELAEQPEEELREIGVDGFEEVAEGGSSNLCSLLQKTSVSGYTNNNKSCVEDNLANRGFICPRLHSYGTMAEAFARIIPFSMQKSFKQAII